MMNDVLRAFIILGFKLLPLLYEFT